MKVVIIGGTAGGAGVAARLRRLDENVEITIIEKNSYISWAGCALPYFAGGVIQDRDTLFLATKEMFYQRFRIEVLEGLRAVGIDRENKNVLVEDAILPTKNPRAIHYDKLVIATGAEAVVPAFARYRNDDGIFTMRSIEDAEGVRNYVKSHNVKSAVVVGGGFIGLEACENLRRLGLKITLVEKAPQVLTPVDPDIANYLHRELDQAGVTLKLGVGIRDIPVLKEEDKAEGSDGAELKVELENGEIINTQMVIMSLGIRPASSFVEKSGVELTSRGYVLVSDTMQTSDPNIFALGDVVTVQDVYEHRLGTIALAGPASKQARVLASNLLLNGADGQAESLEGNAAAHHYHGSLGVSIVRVLHLTAGAVGANRHLLRLQGYPEEQIGEVTVHTLHHVSWFEQALPVHLKVLFDKRNGLILGAQAVGEVSIDKNLEVIAALMQKNSTVYDMVEFESAYAPPFSAPRSPVNMAGSTAVNVVDGLEESISCERLEQLDPEKTVFLDVRTPEEYGAGSIPHFINAPLDSLREYLEEHPIDPNKQYVVTCQVGVRGHTAACLLHHAGVQHVMNLSGGYVSWVAHNYKLKNA